MKMNQLSLKIDRTSWCVCLLVTTISLFLSSCGGIDCTMDDRDSLHVTILDGANNEQELDRVDEISYVNERGERDECEYDSNNGYWRCGYESKELTVTVRLGDRSVTETFQLDADRCHVITKEVSIILP